MSQIRLLTLNLFLRPPLISNPGGDFKDSRTDVFCHSILPSYDIICLQEVFSLFNSRKSRIKSFAQKSGLIYTAESPLPGFFSSHMIDGGLLLLSRFPILESEFRSFHYGIFPDSLADKGVLYCKIEVEGGPLHLFTAHTQSAYETRDMHLARLYRNVTLRQIRTIAEFIREKIQEKGLKMLVGDLNIDALMSKKSDFDAENRDEYIEMMSIFRDLQACDVLYDCTGSHPATFGRLGPDGHPEDTVLTEKEAQGKELSLDYVFTFNAREAGLRVDREGTKVNAMTVKGEPFTQVSDHAGVEVRVVSR